MGFNPFIGTSSRSGGGGTSDVIRYTIVETTRNKQKVYKLQQTINGNTTFVGDEIYFSADDINFNSSWAINVSDALKYLFKSSQANYHFTTFDELGIDSQNKTMEQILQEVLAKDLPINTIITGQLYSTAIPIEGIFNTEGKIQITEGIDGQQIYWCSASSIEIEPYEWESIYNQKVGTTDIQNPLVWTPTHYTLPTASSNTLGGVKVGDTLEISSNGLLEVNKTKLKVIDKIEFTSSTGGALPAIEGATDTYTVYYTDGTSFNYSIINGAKGEKGSDGADGKNGENGKDGITPLFQTTDTALQVSIDGGKTYQDLLMFSVIKGADGKDGKDGEKGEKGDSGDDGITPQFRVTETAIQVSVDNGSTYQDLIELSALMGKKGDDGISITGASVNDEGHLILSLSSGATIDSGNVKGADGTSINIKASLSSSSELPSSGQQLGDCYLINGHLWVYTNSQKETAANGFDDAGSIQGPAGRGITAVAINEDGVLVITYSDSTSSEIGKVKGENGLPGEKGDNGEDGFSPTVSISKTESTTTITIIDKVGEHNAEIKDGEAGQDGKGVELQATEEYIQWRNTGDTNWNNLVAVSALTGPQGEKGSDGKDGKNIELQVSADAIQWRISGAEEWTDLIQLSALKGEEGNGIESIQFTSSTGGETAGIAGATDTYTIIFTNGKTSTFTVYNGNNGDGHTHENKEVLDKLSDHNGLLEYDNDAVSKIWHGTKAEYEAIPEKSDDWTYIITDDKADTYDAKRKVVEFSSSASQNATASNGYIEIGGNSMAIFCCDIEATAAASELVVIVNDEKFYPKRNFYSIMISYVSDGGNGYTYSPVRVYYDATGYIHCIKLDGTNFKVGEKLYYNSAYVLATLYSE